MKKLARCLVPLVMAASAASALAQGNAAEERWVDPRLPAGQAAPGQAAPTPAPATDTVTFGRLSIASVDAIDKLLKDLEAPTTEPLVKSFESVPFLGEGSIATDQPVGFLVTASPNGPLFSPANLVVAVPMKAGKGTPEELAKAGGTAVEGKQDTLKLQDMTVRRTANYLFGHQGDGPSGLAGFTNTPFASDYRTATNLLVAVLDFAKLRAGAPNAYKQLTSMGAFLPMAGEADTSKAVEDALGKIDRITMAFARDEKNLHLQVWQMPWTSKAIKPAPRPAFPAGVIAQTHVVYADAAMAGWVEKHVDEMQEASIPGPAEKRPQVKAFLKRLAKMNSQADAVSVAITMQGQLPLVYAVAQLREEVNLGEELKGLTADFRAVAGETVKVNESTYDAGGKTVQRLEMTGANEQKVYVDAVQQGKVVYFAFSGKEEKVVEGLVSAGMKGTSNALVAGVLDLTAALNAASTGAGGPLSDLPPDALAQLRTAFAGQGVTWTAQAAEGGGNYLYFDLAVPFQAAREVGRVTRAMSGAGGGQ